MAEYTYLKYNISLMLLGGTFKLQTRSAIKKKLYQIWRIVLSSSLLYVIAAAFIDLVQKGIKQFDDVVMNFLYIFISFILWVKTNYYFLLDEKSENILKEMHRLFKYRTKTGLVEKDLRRYIDLATGITKFWFFLATLAAQGYILMFLIFNTSSGRKLPIPLWLPYNWKISPLYELSVLYELFIHQIMALVLVGTDMFFASVVVLTSEQFTLLGWEIKHLLYTVLLKNGVSEEVINSVQVLINDKSHEKDVIEDGFPNELLAVQKIRLDLREDLKQLIKFHQALLMFCDRLEEFFSPMYLPYMFIVFLVNVFLCFILVTTKNVTLRVASALYMLSDMITLFLGCYCGHLLSTKAEDMQYEVYDSPWYICDEVFKFHLKYMHLKMCKPIVLTMGKIAPLSLNSFLWVSKTVISYATILYQLTAENR